MKLVTLVRYCPSRGSKEARSFGRQKKKKKKEQKRYPHKYVESNYVCLFETDRPTGSTLYSLWQEYKKSIIFPFLPVVRP